jgi:hypothetical protein
MASGKVFRVVVVVAAVALSSLTGVALAIDEPTSSLTSGAAAISSSLVTTILYPAVAFLLGSLCHLLDNVEVKSPCIVTYNNQLQDIARDRARLFKSLCLSGVVAHHIYKHVLL